MNVHFFCRISGRLLALIFTLFIIFSPKIVNAQTTSSLTVIPPKFELFANPGDSINEKIRVRNDSDGPMTYTVLIEDFTTSGEEGQVVLEENEQVTSFSLAKWIEPSKKDLILQPNQEETFSFIINIPKNAEPGGHYASILFQTGGDAALAGGANVANRVGTLILLRVSGNVAEDAKLETFSAPKYLEKGPVELLLRIKNDGNTHIRPEGTIVITNTFGKKVDEIPLKGRNVLPGATRKMVTEWDKPNLLGSYTATLIATYGQKNLPVTAAVSFIVLPKLILIGGLLGLTIFVAFIVTLIFGRKRVARILQVITRG